MKPLLLMSLFAFFWGACSTPEQLAQKHLKKAIKLDPGIIQEQTVSMKIKDTVRAVVPVSVPGMIISGPSISVDSLLNVLDSLTKDGKRPEAYIYKDSSISVSFQKDSAGKVSTSISVKPKTIEVPVMVPYEKLITVPGKTITVKEVKPAYTYGWFWLLLGLNIFCVFLALGRKK